MPKIKNENYNRFLKEGIIELLEISDIQRAANNITGKYQKQGRALLFTLYYTGGRPAEILELQPKKINKDANNITIQVPGKKGGLPRTIYLNIKKPGVKEIWEYSQTLHPEAFMFFNYRNNYTRVYTNKKGLQTTNKETTDKLRYYIKKWFTGVLDITPYYLRHNRFSKLSQAGATMDQLRQLKGSKTLESIHPYQHMSTHLAKSISKKID